MSYAADHDAGLGLACRAEHGYVVAVLDGDLGIASAPALREQLISVLSPAATHLIMDLSAVGHADASGLAVLVGSGRRARRHGGSLRLAAPSPEVTRVLSATGMDQHLETFPTVRAAIIAASARLPALHRPAPTTPAGPTGPVRSAARRAPAAAAPAAA